jgi:hypothetical protein
MYNGATAHGGGGGFNQFPTPSGDASQLTGADLLKMTQVAAGMQVSECVCELPLN